MDVDMDIDIDIFQDEIQEYIIEPDQKWTEEGELGRMRSGTGDGKGGG